MNPPMLRAIAACSLCILFCAATFAQQDLQTAIRLSREASKDCQGEHYREAADKWSQALKTCQTLQDTEGLQASCYRNLGNALRQLGKHEEAMGKYQQALKLYQTFHGTELEQKECHEGIAGALTSLGRGEEAEAESLLASNITPTRQSPPRTGTARPAESPTAAQADPRAATARSLYLAAMKEVRARDFQQAVQDVTEALKLYQALPGTEREQASGCQLLGVALLNLKKDEEAMAQHQKALDLYQTLPDSGRVRASCCQNFSVALLNLKKDEEAMAKHQQALDLYRTVPGSEHEQASCCRTFGLALLNLQRCEEAMVQTQQALDLYQTLPRTERVQAACYDSIGTALRNLARYEDAMTQHQQALEILLTLPGTERERAGCYDSLGTDLSNLEKDEEATGRYQKALQLFQALPGTQRQQADCLGRLSATLLGLGKYEEAMAQSQRSLAISQAIPGTEHDQAASYHDLGVLLTGIGKYEEAKVQGQRALAIYQTIPGTEREQAGCYVELGAAQASLGELDQAMGQFQLALKLLQPIQGTERRQATCYEDLGETLRRLGRPDEAMRQYQEALKRYQAIRGTQHAQGNCWGNIGLAHLQARRFSEAIVAFKQASQLSEFCLGLSQAHRRRGEPADPAQALRELLRAAQLAETERAGMLARENREAIFEQGSQVFPELTGLLAELAAGKRTVIEEPEVLRWAGAPQSASAGLEAAFHFADQGKGRSLNDALRERSTLKAARADSSLLAEDRELSQRISKLTTRREGLPESQDEQKRQLTQDIGELQQRRNMLEAELKRTALGRYVAPEFRKPMDMAADLAADTAVLQYSLGEKDIWLLILTRDGVTAHKLGCETTALPEVRPPQHATIRQLVEAWQTRPDKIGLDGLVHLACERAEDKGREAKQNLLDAPQEQAILQRLGNSVLPASALAALRQKKIHHLLVIPDGSLHYVPFAMLRVEDEAGATPHYLLEEFSVSYTPAMTTLETVRKQRNEREQKRKMRRHQLLAFANPDYDSVGVPALPDTTTGDEMVTRVRSIRRDYYSGSGLRLSSLPETEQEAMRVASLFGPPREISNASPVDLDAASLVLTSKAATEEQVKRLLSPAPSALKSPYLTRYRYLLFSTHGLADNQNGMLSCVALSSPAAGSTEDGFLQAQEVMDLELDTDLVMLSACQTGLGRMRGGEGLVGLSGAFFVAGAESISASLWNVPTGPTCQLVTEFFKHLKEGKLDRAEALRQAQLTVMRSGRTADGKSADYSSPFCWAAFVLVGEYRQGTPKD